MERNGTEMEIENYKQEYILLHSVQTLRIEEAVGEVLNTTKLIHLPQVLQTLFELVKAIIKNMYCIVAETV